jgi:hypothetical protein
MLGSTTSHGNRIALRPRSAILRRPTISPQQEGGSSCRRRRPWLWPSGLLLGKREGDSQRREGRAVRVPGLLRSRQEDLRLGLACSGRSQPPTVYVRPPLSSMHKPNPIVVRYADQDLNSILQICFFLGL